VVARSRTEHRSDGPRNPSCATWNGIPLAGWRRRPARRHPAAAPASAPPLGLEDDFTAFTASWLPGDRLLLYTDGLVESRNHHGDFLPEDQIATALLAADCDQALDTLVTAVRRHIGGRSHDDMALLLLEYGAYPAQRRQRTPPLDRRQDATFRPGLRPEGMAPAGQSG